MVAKRSGGLDRERRDATSVIVGKVSLGGKKLECKSFLSYVFKDACFS